MQLPQELVDKIALESLLDIYYSLSIHSKDKNESSIPMFSHDKREEKRRIKSLIKSFEEVIKYYGGSI